MKTILFTCTILFSLFTRTLSQQITTNPNIFNAFRSCDRINGQDHPVMIVLEAHRYIFRALNPENPYTAVSFIYHDETVINNANEETKIKLIFEIRTSTEIKYYGIEITSFGPNGQAIDIERTIMSNRLPTVVNILKITDFDFANINEIECGDQKIIFGSVNYDLRRQNLPYPQYNRNNFNNTGLLNNDLTREALSRRLTSVSSANSEIPRSCHQSRWVEHINILDSQVSSIPQGDDVRCIQDKVPVHSLIISCRTQGYPNGVFRPNGGLSYFVFMQLIFNREQDDTQEAGVEFGNSAVPSSEYIDINIDQADFLTINKYEDETVEFITKDSLGNEIFKINCGAIPDVSTLTPDYVINVKTEDFLGFTNVRALDVFLQVGAFNVVTLG